MEFNTEDLKRAMGSLRLMRYSPLTNTDAATALMEELARMCPSREALDWVVQRSLQLFAEWPGVLEIRAVLCARYKPQDGIEVYSEIYPAGIPPERPSEAAERLALPPGEASGDAEMAGLVAGLAERRALPAGCCNSLTGRKPDGGFCDCRIGQLAREIAERRAEEVGA